MLGAKAGVNGLYQQDNPNGPTADSEFIDRHFPSIGNSVPNSHAMSPHVPPGQRPLNVFIPTREPKPESTTKSRYMHILC